MSKGKGKWACNGDTCTLVEDDKAPAKDAPASANDEQKVDDSGLHAKMFKMLGKKLLTKGDESIETGAALKDAEVVGIYFSAHWCPPCRGFTPELVKWYKKMQAKGKKLEIVFASSDKSDADFKGYFKEMPWLALPYEERKLKAKLSGKFKVSGIPTLVFLDPKTGKATNLEGRTAVDGDPNGDKYPWETPPPKKLPELLKGKTIKTKDGETTFEKLMENNNYVILYFSAHWCPPCRGFTPKFAAWYKKNQPKLKGTDKSFTTIFVSSDRDENAFNDYYKEHPWNALPYAERKLKEELSKTFGVQGIPTVAVVDKEGNVITTTARSGVVGDEDAKEFPWHPKPTKDFEEDPNDINSYPSILFFLEDQDDKDSKLKLLAELSEARKAKCEAEDEDLDMRFFYIKQKGQLQGRIRQMLKITDNKDVTFALMDLGSEGYKTSTDAFTKENVEALIKENDDETINLTSLK